MNTDRTDRNSGDLRWVVFGATAIIIAGMVMIAWMTMAVDRDTSAAVAALGGMVTMGAAGILGLRKMAEKTDAIGVQLNGDLDKRIKNAAKEAAREALEEFTRPGRTI